MHQYELWEHRQSETIRAIVEGAPISVSGTRYGRNDFLLSALDELGLWTKMTDFRPSLKKLNGYSPELLNRVAVVCELDHVGKLAFADPLIRDGKLMVDLGFTLKHAATREAEERPIVHRDTIRNHYKRISEDESRRVFYQYVRFMRGKKWVRKGLYVIDTFEIRVDSKAKSYEGSFLEIEGGVREEETKRRGYLVCFLINVTKGRERVMGFSIGAINQDERDLARVMFDEMKEEGLEPREIIGTLVMDAGFWGAEFLEELENKYKVKYLVRVPKYAQDVMDQIGLAESAVSEEEWEEGYVPASRRRTGKKKVRSAQVEGIEVDLPDGKGSFLANAVVQKEKRSGKRLVMLTNQGGKDKPIKKSLQYQSRWGCENEGVRTFNQEWKVKTPIGRDLAAIKARIATVFMCFNSLKVIEMTHADEFKELEEACRKRGERSLLAGYGVVVYSGSSYGVFSAHEFAPLMAKRENNRVCRLLLEALRSRGMGKSEVAEVIEQIAL